MRNSDQAAFPRQSSQDKEQTVYNAQIGLTKREHFAAMAMQGLLSIYDDGQNAICPNEENVIYMAKLSVRAADELLKQLDNG